MSRVSTDGCSEITCPYHGPENRQKLAELERQERVAVNGHNARAIRYDTGWRRWEAWCPEPGCGVLRDVDGQRAQSREGAEYISDDHARLTACHCYSPETLEWSLDLCPNCAAKETA